MSLSRSRSSLIWFHFFNWRFPFSHMLPLFQVNFILVKATSSHFFRVTSLTVTFSGQLFLQNSCCFLLFQNSHFLVGVIFSEWLLFRSENPIEQPLLESRKFSTAVTFRNSYFFRRNCWRYIYLKRATFSKQVLLHSINFFRKATFWKKLIYQKVNFRITYFFWWAVFLELVLFQKTLTFSSRYLFRRAAFSHDIFSEELLFRSCGSFPHYISYLFVSN